MPNYAAAISGDYYGINHDDLVNIPSNVSTLVDLLEDKGISWGEYQEDMPSVGFTGKAYKNPKTGANMYVRKHNPAVLYDSVANKQDRLAKTKPLTSFNDDLKANALPQWMFITPNMTSDGMYVYDLPIVEYTYSDQAMTPQSRSQARGPASSSSRS